jgi:hypothetical protein
VHLVGFHYQSSGKVEPKTGISGNLYLLHRLLAWLLFTVKHESPKVKKGTF